MKTISKKKIYRRGQKASGLKVGDTVRVTHKAEDDLMGWAESWTSLMNEVIGEIGTVTKISKKRGVKLEFDSSFLSGFWFPWYVLKKVKPTPALFPAPDDSRGEIIGHWTLMGKPVYEVEMDVEKEFGFDIEQMLIDFGMITKKKEGKKDDNK